jgi:CRP/FNR family cyclic AMP-dependent transcriptional regulator
LSTRGLLRGHPFTRDLSEAQVDRLEPCVRPLRFPSGALVFREGAEADTLYLVVSGRVVLEQHVPGKGDLRVETLTGGDILGLSWLLPGGRWVLEARAVEPTEALALDAKALHAIMEGDAPLGLALAKHVIQQLYRRLEHVRLQRLDVYRAGP